MSMFARIERMSLRRKIVVPMVALSVLPAVGICIFIISSMQTSMHRDAVEREVFDTRARARALEEVLWAVQTDLRFLSQTQLLNDLAAARTAGDGERVDTLREQLERELMLFSQGKRSFYQVRYIDTEGREVVRLNVEDGRAQVVPVARLQNKSGRRYVDQSLKLAAGELYVSPMELNIERGRVEVPRRSVLRFGMPLFGRDGERTGIVVLNLDARHIFRLIEPLREGTEAFFVDEDGVYLGYLGESQQQRERFDVVQERRLAGDFSAAQVETILASSDRGSSLETPDALVSIAAIRLTADDGAGRWHLIVTHPRSQFGAPVRRLTVYLSVIIALVLAIVARVGVAVADTLARPVVELRKAMSEIASDRSASMRFAAPGPANEIEALAGEFQSMAQRLEQAQSRLQGMQAGLAKAEKLSSIGQLTSGMVHELGEPLTAIKNKLREAGESNRTPALEALRDNLLADVGRMEAVLQSFTQLANAPRLEPEVTSLASVVKSAVTLVGPEMRRRGVQIEVQAEPGVPRIHGDLNQLRQLFINLILNAADAQPRSERIVMKISAVMPGDSDKAVPIGAAVKVIDDGKGIPTESLVKIWDPFFTTKQDGLGVGLAICRRIVEEHGGRIEVSSQVDHGTAVTVSFP
jgi:signal transduction histidine kinase